MKKFIALLCVCTILISLFPSSIATFGKSAEYKSSVSFNASATPVPTKLGLSDITITSDATGKYISGIAGNKIYNIDNVSGDVVVDAVVRIISGQTWATITTFGTSDTNWVSTSSVSGIYGTDWRYIRIVYNFTSVPQNVKVYTSDSGWDNMTLTTPNGANAVTFDGADGIGKIVFNRLDIRELYIYQNADLRVGSVRVDSDYDKLSASYRFDGEFSDWASCEYQWQISSDGQSFDDISGATAKTLTLLPDYIGKYLRCAAVPLISQYPGRGTTIYSAVWGAYKGYTEADVIKLVNEMKSLNSGSACDPMAYDTIVNSDAYSLIIEIDMDDYNSLVYHYNDPLQKDEDIIASLTEHISSVDSDVYEDETDVNTQLNIALALELLKKSESSQTTAQILKKYIDYFDLNNLIINDEFEALSDKDSVYEGMYADVIDDINDFYDSLTKQTIFEYIENSTDASDISNLFIKCDDVIGIDTTIWQMLVEPDYVSDSFVGKAYTDYQNLASDFEECVIAAKKIEDENLSVQKYTSYVSENFEGDASSISTGSFSVTSDGASGNRYVNVYSATGNANWTITGINIVADNTVFDFRAKPSKDSWFGIILVGGNWEAELSASISSDSWKYYRIFVNSANAETADDMEIKFYVSSDGITYTQQQLTFTKKAIAGHKTCPIQIFRFTNACVDDLEFYKNANAVLGKAKISEDFETLTVSYYFNDSQNSQSNRNSYRWQVSHDGVVFTDISAAVNETITLDASYTGKYIRCVVTPLITKYPGYGVADVTSSVVYRGYTKAEAQTLLSELNVAAADYHSIFTANADMLQIDLEDYNKLVYNNPSSPQVPDSTVLSAFSEQFENAGPYEDLADVALKFNRAVAAQLLKSADSSVETVDIMNKYIAYVDVNSLCIKNAFDSLSDKTPVYGKMYGCLFTDYESVENAIIESTIKHVVKSPVFISDVANLLKDSHSFIGINTDEWLTLGNPDAVSEAVSGKPYATMAELKDAFNKAVSEQKILENSKDTNIDSYKPSVPGVSISGSSGGGSAQVPPQTTQPNKTIFKDISHVSWAHDSIEYLYSRGIINGKANGVFAPDDYVTREEFIKMLVEAFSDKNYDASCSFNDVDYDEWCYKYIALAYKDNIVNGLSADLFGKGTYITRQDMAVMAQRTLSAYTQIKISGAPQFADNADISDYACDAVGALSSAGVINGVGDNCFSPRTNATRAEAAKIIYQMLKLQEV